MGSFRYGPEGGASYNRKMAQQNMELKRNIARYEKDLSQILGKIKSSQKELRKSMIAYTQHARSLRSRNNHNVEEESEIKRIDLNTLSKRAKKEKKLPALERPLPKHLPPSDLSKSSENLPSYEFIQRSHTIPPVRKSAGIKRRPISQKSRLDEKEGDGKMNLGSNFHNSSVTLVAWDSLDNVEDVTETASTTAVIGEVTEEEKLQRETHTKNLLHQAIEQLKDMEHKLQLPPIKRKARLKLSNPLDAIPESDEHSNVRNDVISGARNLPKIVHRKKSRYVPREETILENGLPHRSSHKQYDVMDQGLNPRPGTFHTELSPKSDKRSSTKLKKIRFLKAA